MTDEKKALDQAMEAAVAELKANRKAAEEAAESAQTAAETTAEVPAAEPETPQALAVPEAEPQLEPEAEKPAEKEQKTKREDGKKAKKSAAKKSGDKKTAAKKGSDKKSASATLKELAKVRRNKIIGITAAVVAIMVGIFVIAQNFPSDPAKAMARKHGGEPTVTEEGVKEYPDGTKQYEDGRIENPDGTVEFTDGSVMAADGTITAPDGTITAPDGTVTKPDGTVVPPSNVDPGDSNMNNVQADNGGAGGAAETPWNTMADGDYGVSIRRLNAYNGPFVEDGSDEVVSNVLALQFRNDSAQDIQYAEYVFVVNGEEIPFKLSNLPVGQSCVVLAANKHAYNAAEVLKLKSRLVAAVDALPLADDQILLVDNGDGSVTIMNLTDHTIPVARVFYKTYYAEQDTFFGGITYQIEVKNIPAGGSSGAVSPSHFSTGMSMFVGSGVYDS